MPLETSPDAGAGAAAPAPNRVREAGRRGGFGAVRRAVAAMLAHLGLAPGTLVVAAVSGGADSLALAAALVAEAAEAGLRAGGVTVDHRLQAGSASRAAAVAGTCRELGLDPVSVETAQVDPGSADGPEAAARDARYAALEAAADRLGAPAVLLGHTLDDQAETVLLGLARGSGTRSLAGMPALRGRFARPLLAVRRATTRSACHELGLAPWDDPHNADRSFTRVRARLDALPALEAALGPGVAEALARSADLLRDDADALDASAAQAFTDAHLSAGALSLTTLAGLAPAVRRRVIRRAAELAGVPAGRLTAAHLRTVDALVADWHGQGAVRLPGGVDAVRVRRGSCDTLAFR